MNRREWLKTVGALALGSQAAGCAAGGSARSGGDDLRERAKKNLEFAVFSSVYASLGLEEAARRIAADGFSGVVCDYAFSDIRFDPSAPDWDAAKKIASALEKNRVEIVGLFGYYNVVDPDPARRKRGEERMHFLIRNWERLGSPIIGTETGTFNRESEWVDAPENYTEDGFIACREAFRKLAREAEKTGAVIAIEPYWRNIIDSAARAQRLFEEVDSPSLKLVMDPCNYFRKDDLPRMEPMLRDIFARVGKQIVLAHAKDVKASAEGTDLPASGLGVLDYPLYLRLLAGLDRRICLAVEHLALADVARARDFVKAQFERI
ncbi:MAG: sugar phosphate isomerase/epimerase [Planctomycetes bacterium]|nr:sugar phosphate isomerase/epimerase [Planctomycetota bacterium]